jgi:type II secretory pathway pseudopilin PulG
VTHDIPIPVRSGRRAAFTLIEALVSVALLLAIMLAVAQVFSMSSTASGRAIGQAETIEAAAVFEQAVRSQLARLKPSSLLIIESPPPLLAHPESDLGPAAFSIRHDRLVFIAAGAADEFQSATDREQPSSNYPGGRPFTSSEAFIYFGPGDPDGQGLPNVPARDWLISQRVILLGADAGAFRSFTGEAPLPAGGLPDPFVPPPQGIYACGIDAVDGTAAQVVAQALTRLGSGLPIRGYWDLTRCPTRLGIDPPGNPSDQLNYYRRAAFNLQNRIADLRIEWTDGSPVDPRPQPGPPLGDFATYQPIDPATQWFGQRRDTSGARGWTDPAPAFDNVSGDVVEHALWWARFSAAGAPVPPALPVGPLGVEFYGTYASPAEVRYRAIWTPVTWDARPKALRFTFRVYDAQDRLATEEAYDQTPWTTPTPYAVAGQPVAVKRSGLEYSFVVRLPS